MNEDDPRTSCPLHGYSEKSARAKLSRHRKRGDLSVSAIFHEDCGQWHVEKFGEDES